MRTRITYHDDGTKTVTQGAKQHSESYDAQIDAPMHERVLKAYRKLESEGKLRPSDIIHSKAYMRQVHENAMA